MRMGNNKSKDNRSLHMPQQYQQREPSIHFSPEEDLQINQRQEQQPPRHSNPSISSNEVQAQEEGSHPEQCEVASSNDTQDHQQHHDGSQQDLPDKQLDTTNDMNMDSPHIDGHDEQSEQKPEHPSATATVPDDRDTESTYHLKWVPWNSGKIPIVMQSINGPCPLIATMNVLLLREKIKLPNMLEQITADQLLTYIGECIMDSVPEDVANDENAMLNLEQNIHDAMEILPKLKTGLDVNIRFAGIDDFEYTPECIIFDLLRIPLYHGWLIDPELIELKDAIGNQSYNQLVEYIITNKNSQDPRVSTRVLIAEEFLDKTASQLTLHGLQELKSSIKDNEISILFRNNHFLTLFKRDGEIYTLVTDHGYLFEEDIIWETLENIEGAGRFFDSGFQVAETSNRQVSELNAMSQRQQQMENDFLMALSLKEE